MLQAKEVRALLHQEKLHSVSFVVILIRRFADPTELIFSKHKNNKKAFKFY